MASGAKGRAFESRRARHRFQALTRKASRGLFLCLWSASQAGQGHSQAAPQANEKRGIRLADAPFRFQEGRGQPRCGAGR